jgi:hypothetical protein
MSQKKKCDLSALVQQKRKIDLELATLKKATEELAEKITAARGGFDAMSDDDIYERIQNATWILNSNMELSTSDCDLVNLGIADEERLTEAFSNIAYDSSANIYLNQYKNKKYNIVISLASACGSIYDAIDEQLCDNKELDLVLYLEYLTVVQFKVGLKLRYITVEPRLEKRLYKLAKDMQHIGAELMSSSNFHL